MENHARMRFKFSLLFVVLAFLIGSGRPAPAYVIPSWKIVQMAQEKNSSVQNMRVARQTFLFDRIFDGGKIEVQEELFFTPLNGFRVKMNTPSGETVFVDDGRSSVTMLNNRIIDQGTFRGSVHQLFFSRREPDEIYLMLRRMGIDTSVVSLGRMSGRVVMIIGAKPGDLGRPQIWVDKETLLPLRFVGPDHLYRDGSYVVRDFYDHFQVDSAVWFPRIVRAFVGSTPVRTSEVLQAQTNTAMPRDFFSVSNILATTPHGGPREVKPASASPPGSADLLSSPDSELRDEGQVDVNKLYNDFQRLLK